MKKQLADPKVLQKVLQRADAVMAKHLPKPLVKPKAQARRGKNPRGAR